MNMTDEFGIIQFAEHSKPDITSGYTLDDNARALIFSAIHYKLFKDPNSLNLAKIYLNFLKHSQESDGNFKNNYKNEEEKLNSHSEDALGRAIWALGYTINKSDDFNLKEDSRETLKNSTKIIRKIQSPRAKAFMLDGLCHYHKERPDEEILSLIKNIANSLVMHYDKESSEKWNWFESYLTYSNAKLPEALFLAYEVTKEERYLEIAKKSLTFLSNTVFIDGELSPIGQNGWYNRNGERAFFDQQPLDVSCMVQAHLTAYRLTKNKEYKN